MTTKTPQKALQKASRKNLEGAQGSGSELVTLPVNLSGSLEWWIDQYFKFEVTTAKSSQAVQKTDLALFLSYVNEESGGDRVEAWTPRLSRSFQDGLRKEIDIKDGQGKRRLSDRTINRVMAHLKTFSKRTGRPGDRLRCSCRRQRSPKVSGRLAVNVVNGIWNEVAEMAGVEGKTPHSARHAMGRHIIEKTGNIATVQRQLGHKKATYSMKYARISERELADLIEDRKLCKLNSIYLPLKVLFDVLNQ